MWPYWMMFIIPAFMAMRESVRHQVLVNPWKLPLFKMPNQWWFVMILFGLLVGWRHEVGADWSNYLRIFDRAFYASIDLRWWLDDPGYRFLEWVSIKAGFGIHAVNLIGGFLFSLGLIVFCRHLPRPWLALAVATPYLVITIAMGYSRQGIAIGLAMIGLVALSRGQLAKFIFWTVVGATFHKSAVILLPIAALAASKRRLINAIWVGVVALVAYATLLEDSVDNFTTNYIEAAMQSQGALIRLIMNALPAVVLLLWRRRFAVTLPQERLWFWLSLAAIALLVLYFFTPATTALDRVGLYLLPLQLMVFSYLPEALGSRRSNNSIWVIAVLAYYAAVEFVWLNYAAHAYAWIPYRFYPFEDGL